MLVIAIQKGGRVRIGDEIEVVVTDVKETKVLMGIITPPKMPAHKKERLEKQGVEN